MEPRVLLGDGGYVGMHWPVAGCSRDAPFRGWEQGARVQISDRALCTVVALTISAGAMVVDNDTTHVCVALLQLACIQHL